MGALQLKLPFLADASAKALTPPPRAVGGAQFYASFFVCINFYVFEEKTIFGYKGKILGKGSIFENVF